MKFIKKKKVLDMNKAVIDRYGGAFSEPFNLKNEKSLDYLLDIAENNEVKLFKINDFF